MLATRSRRWALAGAACGALAALALNAPARWLAAGVAGATEGRVLLAEASGSLWDGSARVVLSAGPGSRDATVLPGRLDWSLRPHWRGLRLELAQPCCLNGRIALQLQLGWKQWRARIEDEGRDWIGQWPAAVLAGLGLPWNTMQPGGSLRLSARGAEIERVDGRLRLQGQLQLGLHDLSSRLTPLPRLGSYQLTISADPASPGTAQLLLGTLDGALRLQGQGSWGMTGVRLRGEASAAPEDRPALDNLLNIIGRRDGARSLLSIG